jgi:hypothetical protein
VTRDKTTSALRGLLDSVDETMRTDRGRRAVVSSAAAIVVLAALGAGALLGPGAALLILAAGTLLAAIGSLWTSMRALFGETKLSPEDAFAIGAPSAEEEQKRAVLRAIKDLEFERAVGKISEMDYRSLVSHYRAEAKRLLRLLDERAAPKRAAVEGLVEKHLASRGLSLAASTQPSEGEAADAPAQSSGQDLSEERSEPSAKSDTDKRDSAQSDSACPECDTDNDPDAVFCKKCGTRLGEEDK